MRNDERTTPLEQWTVRSRDGDESALNHLAEYLLPKAFDFANRKMMHLSPMDDYEDVAISAVKSVCLRFRQGRNEFLGEKELDGLLRQFVIGKIRDRRKYHLRDKRDVELNIFKDDSQIQVPQQFGPRETLRSIWLDEHSSCLPLIEQAYLEEMLTELGADVQGLFSELVKRLDDNPRKVLMLITTRAMSNQELAKALDCAPSSIERYRHAIRRKLEEIVTAE
ncbi:MAG: ECF-type sigma factor [Pirellulaceae bacterium]|nr:ECF-type sigma factor [Pirellulaceae bacterium]